VPIARAKSLLHLRRTASPRPDLIAIIQLSQPEIHRLAFYCRSPSEFELDFQRIYPQNRAPAAHPRTPDNMLLNVKQYGDPVLRAVSAPVEHVDDELKTLVENMLETMYATNGVGLAGNQVGRLQRLVVIDCGHDTPDPIKMVNPEIISRSETRVCHNEGCLSVPREYADVERWEYVTVRYTDENGKEQIRETEGLLAIAVQHELDHLEGKLFIDYLSPLKRKMLLKHLEKRRKKMARLAQEAEVSE
jgi:peptide deformylase